MTVTNFLKREGDLILLELKENGFIQGGQNGPYDDNETPVRVSSHWIIIFSWLYGQSHEEKYYKAIKILSDYLMQQNISSTHNVFHCRDKDGKDHVNGTIGQAWAIEGLVKAAIVLKDERLYDLAVKVFLNHPYDKETGMWNRYEITGVELGFDETFNHQLWFAAAGSEILTYRNHDLIREQISDFLDHCIEKNIFRIYQDGVISHYSKVSENLKTTLRFMKINYTQKLRMFFKRPNMRYKEEGYHYFALYAFGILKEVFYEHPIFESKELKKAVEYAVNPENYLRQLNIDPTRDGTGLATKTDAVHNIYFFAYNSPAFELPYIVKQFAPNLYSDELIDNLWDLQKEVTMDEHGRLSRNTEDIRTLTARSYEIVRALS